MIKTSSIFNKATTMLPQAIWYHTDLPEEGIVVLDSFVLRYEHTSDEQTSTHIRLMVMQGDGDEQLERLQVHHSQTYQKLQTRMPHPPEGAVVIGHVSSDSDDHIEYSYTVMREIAEKLAKAKSWPFSDISINQPSIRKTDSLDMPLYQQLPKVYSTEELPKKPMGVFCQEKKNCEEIATWGFSSYTLLVMIPAVLVALAMSVVMLNSIPLLLVIPVNVAILLVFSLAMMVRTRIVLDNEGIFVETYQVIFWLVKTNREKQFMNWEKVEEIQTMSSNRQKVGQEQLAIISDNHLIGIPTSQARWIWQKIMTWLSENSEKIGQEYVERVTSLKQ